MQRPVEVPTLQHRCKSIDEVPHHCTPRSPQLVGIAVCTAPPSGLVDCGLKHLDQHLRPAFIIQPQFSYVSGTWKQFASLPVRWSSPFTNPAEPKVACGLRRSSS